MKFLMDDYRFKIADNLQSVAQPHVLKKNIIKAVNDLGFSDIDIAFVQTNLTTNHVRHMDLSFLTSTAPTEIYEAYIGEELYKHDLALDYISSTTKPTFNAEAINFFTNSPYSKSYNIQKCKKILMVFKSYDYHDAFTIPIKIDDDLTLLFSIMQKGESEFLFRRNVMKVKPQLMMLAEQAARVLSFPGYIEKMQTNRNRVHLTPKEIQILEALAKYPLTQPQIAEFLNISERTVQERIKNIKNKLGTETLCTSIYKAITLNLIK